MTTFKKAQVKLLSTKESDIILNNENKLIWLNVPLIYTERITSVFPHHLYIVNDDEIKEGEWFYSESSNTITQNYKLFIGKNNIIACKKIIASTDKSLNLSTVSDYFIAYYIEAYNRAKPITDVLVEYENDILKIHSNNAIFAKNLKDSWNREEVYDIVNSYLNYLIDPNSNKNLTGKEWLDQNL